MGLMGKVYESLGSLPGHLRHHSARARLSLPPRPVSISKGLGARATEAKSNRKGTPMPTGWNVGVFIKREWWDIVRSSEKYGNHDEVCRNDAWNIDEYGWISLKNIWNPSNQTLSHMKEQNVSQGYQLSLTLNEAENALEGVSDPFVLGEGGMQAWVPNTKSDSGAKHGQVCHSLYAMHTFERWMKRAWAWNGNTWVSRCWNGRSTAAPLWHFDMDWPCESRKNIETLFKRLSKKEMKEQGSCTP